MSNGYLSLYNSYQMIILKWTQFSVYLPFIWNIISGFRSHFSPLDLCFRWFNTCTEPWSHLRSLIKWQQFCASSLEFLSLYNYRELKECNKLFWTQLGHPPISQIFSAICGWPNVLDGIIAVLTTKIKSESHFKLEALVS